MGEIFDGKRRGKAIAGLWGIFGFEVDTIPHDQDAIGVRMGEIIEWQKRKGEQLEIFLAKEKNN